MLLSVRYLLERNTFNGALETGSFFFKNNDKESVKKYQLERFNVVWKDAFTNIPFYKKWKDFHNLPETISDLEELIAWPVLKKTDIQKDAKLLCRSYAPKSYAITSGSTGVPLRIPSTGNQRMKYDAWIGRVANGIKPCQKTFLIWGHEHLHGTGMRRIINKYLRKTKDYLLGYLRVSAYDTSVRAMQSAYKKYASYKPSFVVGYSSSILSFVRSNKNKASIWFPQLVLCTAGPLSEKEKDEVREFFKAPLCMEYGSVECGVMAYSVNNCNHYNVLSNTHLIQGQKDENGSIRNIVTNLADKYFPLIRYDIGDYLNLSDTQDLESIQQINYIEGRPTDIVALSNGTSFFAMLIEACIEHLDGLVAHQLVVNGNDLEILIVALRPLEEKDFESVRENLYSVVPDIHHNTLSIKQVSELYKNKGGKTPIVIRR